MKRIEMHLTKEKTKTLITQMVINFSQVWLVAD